MISPFPLADQNDKVLLLIGPDDIFFLERDDY